MPLLNCQNFRKQYLSELCAPQQKQIFSKMRKRKKFSTERTISANGFCLWRSFNFNFDNHVGKQKSELRSRKIRETRNTHTNRPGEIQDEAEHAKIAIRWELLPFELLLTNCAACGSPKKGCCSYHRLSVLASWPQLFSYGMCKGDIKTCWTELFNCCEQNHYL